MKHTTRSVQHVVIFLFLVMSIAFAQKGRDDFQEGCCLNDSLPRPRKVSQATLPKRTLLEALYCAANNPLMGGTRELAKSLGDKKGLRVAYYYGLYMPEQDYKALTIAVYSADGKAGWLFDIDEDGQSYSVANLPEIRKSSNHWRVGEINGGLWSYTRLWYLAQEIGSRPKQEFLVSTVISFRPKSCDLGHPIWGSRVVR